MDGTNEQLRQAQEAAIKRQKESEREYPEKGHIGGTLVICCLGGCGKTTEGVSPREFWEGRVEQSVDPECLVPEWTCKDCVAAGK